MILLLIFNNFSIPSVLSIDRLNLISKTSMIVSSSVYPSLSTVRFPHIPLCLTGGVHLSVACLLTLSLLSPHSLADRSLHLVHQLHQWFSATTEEWTTTRSEAEALHGFNSTHLLDLSNNSSGVWCNIIIPIHPIIHQSIFVWVFWWPSIYSSSTSCCNMPWTTTINLLFNSPVHPPHHHGQYQKFCVRFSTSRISSTCVLSQGGCHLSFSSSVVRPETIHWFHYAPLPVYANLWIHLYMATTRNDLRLRCFQCTFLSVLFNSTPLSGCLSFSSCRGWDNGWTFFNSIHILCASAQIQWNIYERRSESTSSCSADLGQSVASNRGRRSNACRSWWSAVLFCLPIYPSTTSPDKRKLISIIIVIPWSISSKVHH